MDKDGIYSVFPDEQELTSSSQLVNRLLYDSEKPKRKRKGEKKKKKLKKFKKVITNLLKPSQKKKRSKVKKGKKSKGKSKKSQKQKSVEFKYRIIEKAADKTLNTASNIIEMYAESKFFPNGRTPKGK